MMSAPHYVKRTFLDTMVTPRKQVRDKGFAERVVAAWVLFQNKTGGSRTQTWLGEALGEAMDRKPFHQATVSNWMKGEIPTDHNIVVAMAEVLSWEPGAIDPGWLLFGVKSAAPPPPDPFQATVIPLDQPSD